MIRQDLIKLEDLSYKTFHKKLIPNILEEKIIGIRIPILRKYAKDIYGTKEAEEFMQELPHYYYEENNLHAFLIEQIKDFELCIEKTNQFLPYIDNWATCDSMTPKVLKKDLIRLLNEIKNWLESDHTYVIRFGIEMLMKFYLDDSFKKEYLELVSDVKSEEYYVKMMVAWYFATALAKQYDEAIVYLEEQKLEPWTHNKAIQKAIESSRICEDKKQYLRSLKHHIR